jgi:hypothetical protein
MDPTPCRHKSLPIIYSNIDYSILQFKCILSHIQTINNLRYQNNACFVLNEFL